MTAPEGISNPNITDLDLAEAALSGDEAAAAQIRSPEQSGRIEAALRNRGASPTEASDIAADLWADCFDTRDGRSPLLEKYSGKGALSAFLTRAALNRLIDYKRRQKFRGQLPSAGSEPDGGDGFDRLPDSSGDAEFGEDQLVALLREALLAAFAKVDPEKLVILKLVNVHGLDQGAVAKMWGWSQSKVSRTIGSVINDIREQTIGEMRRIDPWLELKWEDFIHLCAESSGLFADAA